MPPCARKLDRRGYREIRTPLILNEAVWARSGHLDHYRDNMFFIESDQTRFGIKPMNCPGAALVYRSDIRSFRDLPLRFSEFGHCHRFEPSGVLSGLTRVRPSPRTTRTSTAGSTRCAGRWSRSWTW